MGACKHTVCVLVASFQKGKEMQTSGGKTRPVFGKLTVMNCSEHLNNKAPDVTAKEIQNHSFLFSFPFWEWCVHLQLAIKPMCVPGINVSVHVRPLFFFTFVSWNQPVISSINCLQGPQKYHLYPSFHPSASCGSLIFVRHRSWRCGTHAWKQPVGRGSICNQTVRSGVKSQEEAASPMPVGWGSDDEEACFRHSTPPTGTLMQAACKPTPHTHLSAGG